MLLLFLSASEVNSVKMWQDEGQGDGRGGRGGDRRRKPV